MTDLPPQVRAVLERAGWQPGRRVPVPARVPADHPAHELLAAFGGLTVGENGPGEEGATAGVWFAQTDATGPPVIESWGRLLATRLVLLADVSHGHAELYVDDAGRCFQHSSINDGMTFLGDSFGAAVERLILGRRGRPMLRPGQTSVSWYGEVIRPDDPVVYRY